MEAWLICKVNRGMFSSEYAVRATSFDGSEFSLFAPKDMVQLAEEPPGAAAVDGWLRVELTARQGDLQLVRLPQEAFGVGQFATVRSHQLCLKNGSMQSLPAEA